MSLTVAGPNDRIPVLRVADADRARPCYRGWPRAHKPWDEHDSEACYEYEDRNHRTNDEPVLPVPVLNHRAVDIGVAAT